MTVVAAAVARTAKAAPSRSSLRRGALVPGAPTLGALKLGAMELRSKRWEWPRRAGSAGRPPPDLARPSAARLRSDGRYLAAHGQPDGPLSRDRPGKRTKVTPCARPVRGSGA